MFSRRIQDIRSGAVLGGISLMLAGCQGMYLHNPDRAAVASTARKNVDAVDVDAISKAERGNLARMLDQEIKSIDDRSKLVASLAVIQLGTGEQLAAKHYLSAMAKVSSTFKTGSMLTLQARRECGSDLEGFIEQDGDLKGVLEVLGARNIPACKPPMPQTLSSPGTLAPERTQQFNAEYEAYRTHCTRPERSCQSIDADRSVEKEMVRLTDAKRRADQQKVEVNTARAEYVKVLNANKAKTQSAAGTEDGIKAKASDLLKSLNTLAEKSPDVANQIKGQALVELLSAAAGGKVDSNDPDLAPALELAKSLPALAQSIEAARAAREQVPVSHLLLALNNLVIAADRDDRLAALEAEELTVLKRKLAAFEAQAELWLTYSNNMCNLALIADGRGYPGQTCDTIELAPDRQESPTKYSCTIRFREKPNGGTKPAVRIDDCVLGKSWHELFKGPLTPPAIRTQSEVSARRSLYEAVAAYLHIRLNAYTGTEEEFRRIDIEHRRSVVQREAALAQWKNVIAIPTIELEAYYNGGMKPAEIADLLVKALGFTAIAIGVSK